MGVEPGKAGEGGLRPARRRSGREDEQVAGADLEVMIADEGCGREAEGTAGGLLRGEARKLTRADHNGLAHAALAKVEVSAAQHPGDDAALGVQRWLLLLVEIQEVIVDLRSRLAQSGGHRTGGAVVGLGGKVGELVEQARGQGPHGMCADAEEEQILRAAAGRPAWGRLGERARGSGEP